MIILGKPFTFLHVHALSRLLGTMHLNAGRHFKNKKDHTIIKTSLHKQRSPPSSTNVVKM